MVNAFRWMVFVIGLAVVIGSIVTSAGDPTIAIYSPSDDDTVYTDTITVKGGANMGTEGAVVESVTVNGVLVDGTTSWSEDISLQPGQNKITAVATDISNKWAKATITVTYIPPTPSPTPTTTTPTPSPTPSNGPSPRPTPTPTSTLTPTLIGSISITTIPSGAEVYLDKSFEGITPITLKDITVGFHSIKVIKEGYRNETRSNIYLGAGITKELNIELKPITGSIFVSSTPSGASVYLDNVYMKANTTCMLSKVVVGQHTIKLTKSDYFDFISNVSVSDSSTPTYLHENLTGYGSIDISSDPSGAKVYLDGNYTGETTPANISKVALGNHTIKLTKFGYFNATENVSVSVGRTPPVDVNLTGYGSLSIDSDPYGARVYLDGNYTGVTPLYLDKLDEGNHSIRLTKRSYKDVTQEIHVSAGNTISVSKPLSLTFWGRKEPWIPVYIAIIGVIGVIIVAFMERNFIVAFIERKKRNK